MISAITSVEGRGFSVVVGVVDGVGVVNGSSAVGRRENKCGYAICGTLYLFQKLINNS